VLEKEGTCPNYLYLLLRGHLYLYKRPEILYDKEGKMIMTGNNQLEGLVYPTGY